MQRTLLLILWECTSPLFHSKRFWVGLLLAASLLTYRAFKKRGRDFFSFQNLRPALPDLLSAGFVFLCSFLIGSLYMKDALQSNEVVFFIPTKGHSLPPSDYGWLLGSTALILYGIFRLAMGRTVAVLFCLCVAASNFQLFQVGSSPLRDYLRVPYLLALLFFMGALVRWGTSYNRFLKLSGAMGLTIGLGQYLREELIFFSVPAVLTILAFCPPGVCLRKRLGGLVVFLFCLYMTVPFPLVRFHPLEFAAGYMSPMDQELKLSRPPYDIGYLFIDEHIGANTELFGSLYPDMPPRLAFIRPYLSYFPADLLVRIYASLSRVFELAFVYQLAPQGVHQAWLTHLYSIKSLVQSALFPFSIPLAVFTFLCLALCSLRMAGLYLVWSCFVGALITTQFFGRNFAYMEFLSWWNFGFLTQLIWKLSRRQLPRPTIKTLLRCTALTMALIVLAAGSLFALRKYQTVKVQELFYKYDHAATQIFPNQIEFSKDRALFLRPISKDPFELLVARFVSNGCPVQTVHAVLQYQKASGKNSRLEWSRTLQIPISKTAAASLYFPAWSRFIGIELPKEASACLRSFERIHDPYQLPLLATVLTGSQTPLFQRLGNDDTSRSSDSTEQKTRTTPAQELDINFVAPIAKRGQHGFQIEGFATSPKDPHRYPSLDRSRSTLSSALYPSASVSQIDTDLLLTKPVSTSRGSLFLVEGFNRVAAVSIGLLRDGMYAGHVTISERGPFVVLLRAEYDGNFQLGIANNFSWYTSLETRMTIDKIGLFQSTRSFSSNP
ncbi:MAG: hypothetical protein HY537_04920 [Deltaproteobacteria bacterium]|nr:hypothetical protein [Deltaproteobacteria bacterium]